MDTALQVIVSPLLGTILDGIRSLAENEFRRISDVNKEFICLSDKLSTIQLVIEDAEEKQLTQKPILKWLRDLKNVMHDVEDFMDECKTDAALRGSPEILKPSSGCNNIKEFITVSVPSFFCYHPSSSSRHTIAIKVESFIERFKEITEQRSFHLISNVTPADAQSGRRQQRETTSYTDEPIIYGREKDTENIVKLLKNDAGGSGNDRQGRDVSVFPIVGMGGLGKTTLAQKIYHDERIEDHFGFKCWICVSEDFNPTRLIKTILTSLGEKVIDNQNLDNQQSHLRAKLSGKRFLVVLDDVWNDDQGLWQTLKTSLSCGDQGSFILVTTRLKRVASIMATLPSYYPGILSEEDCWSLFKQRAFACGEENCYPELVAIGRDILKKCCGIPLAAKALGGLLRFKRERKEWLNVKESDIWKLHDDASDAILSALQLSYKHLSSQLKQCFAYCSVFPKDYVMKKEELIFSWMANGFIQSKGRIMDLEDVGNQIFNDLSYRSFFQDFEKDEEGNITRCKMHDLMHDLARSVMGDECLFVEGDYNKAGNQISSTISSTRYVFWNNMKVIEYSFLGTMLRIREFRIDFPWHLQPDVPLNFLQFIFSNLKFLRVLNLKNLPIDTIPDSIGNLKHLRYFNLSFTPIKSLPDSLCCLINLQILNLECCYHLTCLPRYMGKMTNLRHLNTSYCSKLRQMPSKMGELNFLQTLNMFVVGEESGSDITELKDLQYLKGEIEISGLEHVKNETDARNSNLILREHLQSLDLWWGSGSPDTEEEERAQLSVGEGLQPHPNLKRLSIHGFGGVRFPRWVSVSSCLPNLVEISLEDCCKCERLPELGKLPLLRILKLNNMDSMKCTSEFFHHGDQVISFFPSLQELYITDMIHFGELSSPSTSSPSSSWQSLSSNQPRSTPSRDRAQVSSYPCLRILEIVNCPELTSFISLPPSLGKLVLTTTHEDLLLKYLKHSPSSLSRLEIVDFPNLVSFPVDEEVHEEGRLVNLNYLSIRDRLETLHMNKGSWSLTNLQELKISACPELEFSHEDDADFQKLISLRVLKLYGLAKMAYLPPLPFLTALKISNCSALMSLPEWMPSLPSLQYLKIDDCENLTSLSDGLQRLTALKTLSIVHCKNLKSLPDEGLERLASLSLRGLEIWFCHQDLHTQCRNKEGHYWEKISHISEMEHGYVGASMNTIFPY